MINKAIHKNVYRGEKGIFDFINPENHYTPLVELPESLNPFKKEKINIFVKLSWFNALLNIKLIPSYWMIKTAREKDYLNEVKKLIEASSGNTAYSLKILSKYFGIQNFIALVSYRVAEGKRKILDLLGIKYKIRKEDICPDPADPKSSINIAKSFRNKKGWYNLGQYDNPANWEGHYHITAKQTYEQLDGDIDIISVGLGTTGTLIGISKFFKDIDKKVIIVGVIREKNNLVPGVRTLNLLKEVQFKWQEYLDYKIFVGSEESYLLSLKLIREGLFVGPSSGFAFAGLLKFIKENFSILEEIRNHKGYVNCVFISPDTFLPYVDDYFKVINVKDIKEINLLDILNLKLSKNIIDNNEDKLSLTCDELLKILTNKKENYVLIDIRNKYRFEDAHIPGSLNIEYSQFLKKYTNFLEKFKNEKIILICDYDVKSAMLVNFLNKRFNNSIQIFYLEGGISEWSIKNYPRQGMICEYNK